MLNPSDVYVSGGSNDLLVCWTDKVTKYDASSFYNWEQDNLPLHDLDERTHLLWEKFGHPTSALTGMSFIVSADATSACNPLYFTTLSACINALPEVINCPILVEVASFGNLGGLNLSNKAFGPNGSIEIVNRNSAFAGAIDISGVGMAAQEYDSAYTDYNLASAVVPISTAMTDLQGGASSPCLTYDMQSAQMYVNGQYISSAVNRWEDERYNNFNPYVFSRKVAGLQNNRLTAALSSTANAWDIAAASYAAASSFEFTPYDKARTESKIDEYDVSTVNYLTDSEIKWGNGSQDGGNNTAAAAFAYFNNLDYIKVNDCNGPVYIRNFTVDGQHSRERGIEIKNSTVNLERCSVSRCTQAGLYAESSEVNLLRGFVGYRNYGFEDNVRVGSSFALKRRNYMKQDSYGAGIYAVNSVLNIKSTYDRDADKSVQASSDVYTDYTGGIPAPSMEALYCLSRNDIGIHCINSEIIGGRTELNGSSTTGGNQSWRDATQLISELNTEAGIRLSNSVVDHSGRILLDGNYLGLDSANSKLSIDSIAARHNQDTGIKLSNSELEYNKDLYAGYLRGQTPDVGPESYLMSQIACVENSQDIKCDNSIVRPLYTSSMPDVYEMVYTASSFGLENSLTGIATGRYTLLPSIEANNNSELDLIHTHIDRTSVDNDMPSDGESCYGAMVRAVNNSNVTFRGSKAYANVFLGPPTRIKAHPVAAIYAGKNSKVSFQGPTVIAQVGVDVLADQHSIVDFGPHRDGENGLLVSSFNLSGNPDNHTMVELHSTRACLVADQQSEIYMKDLGDYSRLYADSSSVSGRTDNYDYDINDLYNTCVSNGWMQLYPNGNTDDADVPNAVANLPVKGSTARYRFITDGAPTYYKYLESYATLDQDASNVTTGGMSVRAIGDSLVQVTNVHFPCGWANCSSYAYDFDGAAPLPGPVCSRLHIWNIADSSLLKASYVSVSGVHPVDAAYHGPSGEWGVSEAPSSTPDTSSISILDYYGKGPGNPFGKDSIQNVGPFRLYFSVDPAARFLDASAGGLSGIVHQLFSQGYSFSGPAVARDNSDYGASANYISLLRRNEESEIHASGFYYPSEMLSNPDTILVSLDDSAANMFANAKHNSVDKSLIGKRVEIFYPTDGFGADAEDTLSGQGKGLLSVNNFDLKKDN